SMSVDCPHGTGPVRQITLPLVKPSDHLSTPFRFPFTFFLANFPACRSYLPFPPKSFHCVSYVKTGGYPHQSGPTNRSISELSSVPSLSSLALPPGVATGMKTPEKRARCIVPLLGVVSDGLWPREGFQLSLVTSHHSPVTNCLCYHSRLAPSGGGMGFEERLGEVRSGFERSFWVANVSELFERLSYYAAFASLARYLRSEEH